MLCEVQYSQTCLFVGAKGSSCSCLFACTLTLSSCVALPRSLCAHLARFPSVTPLKMDGCVSVTSSISFPNPPTGDGEITLSLGGLKVIICGGI
uniref:Uncharacterized protein n=1 Tax=Hippocampus comes TaxID=109280 RepID=A0A3Q3DJ31_HIPCM